MTLWNEGSSIAEIVARLPGRTAGAVLTHAKRTLRLRTGQPRGTMAMKPLARALGYSLRKLAHILEWAGVERASYSRKLAPKIKHGAIPFEDAKRAVLRWENGETFIEAAKRLGINQNTLREIMERAGLRPKKSNGRYHSPRWKNDSSDYDKAVDEWRKQRRSGMEGVREAAKRLGVSSRKMVHAHQLTPTSFVKVGNRHMYSPEEHDRVLAIYQSRCEEKRLKSLELARIAMKSQRAGHVGPRESRQPGG